MNPLRVSSRSDPNAVAGALAAAVRHAGGAVVQVVGAGALNQAVKAVAIARQHLGPEGIDLVCAPQFAEIELNGELRTAVQLVVHDRTVASAATGGEVIDLRETGPTGAAPGPRLPGGRATP